MTKFFQTLSAVIVLCFPAQASDDIRVTADRMEEIVPQSLRSRTRISGLEVEKRGSTAPEVLLRAEPGIDATRAGGLGGATGVMIRGASSEHTLVLQDGIPLNDPMSPGRMLDFSSLTLDNLEQIEVLRGPQGPLYGSDALGGAIELTTRRGKGPLKTSFKMEAGSYSTFREALGLAGGGPGTHYALFVSRTDSKGISSANSRLGNGEADGFLATSASLRAGAQMGPQTEVDINLRLSQDRTEQDNFGGVGGDDPNAVSQRRSSLASAAFRSRFLEDAWKSELRVSYFDQNRTSQNDRDLQHPVEESTHQFKAKRLSAKLKNEVEAGEYQLIILGAELQEERGESRSRTVDWNGETMSSFPEKRQTTSSVFVDDEWLTDALLPETLYGTAGVRADQNAAWESVLTYRGSLAYPIAAWGLKPHASMGTGFKSPTLFQIYSQYGNSRLQAERSQAWDAGAVQTVVSKVLSADVTYFENRIRNLIDYDFVRSRYFNLHEAFTHGVETALQASWGTGWSSRLSYTFLRAYQEPHHAELLRRARHRGKLVVNFSEPDSPWSAYFEELYVGPRADVTELSRRTRLPSYFLTHLGGSYRFNRVLTAGLRIENLLHKRYEEVYGYGTEGFGAYFSLKAEF